ncbi:MAG: hypothetical protein JKY13_00730 [Gammaproteobacteria bacterium]|nr:hypothetical protein [Gammaproteobacteria bacterium]
MRYRSNTVKTLLQQALPLSQRQLRFISVEKALLLLGGESYQLVLDPKHPFIAFVLKPTLQRLYKQPTQEGSQ